MKDLSRKRVTGYGVSCRQMAYEYGLSGVVDAIDELSGTTWPTAYLRTPQPRRVKRLRRTVSQLAPPAGDDENDGPKGHQSEAVDDSRSVASSEPSNKLTAELVTERMMSSSRQNGQADDCILYSRSGIMQKHKHLSVGLL
jgi:hypothetical protein